MPQLARLIATAGFEPDLPVSLCMVNSSGRLFQAAAGVWSDGRPVTPNDRMYCASLAKQLTGAAAAVLVRQGRLDPDAPIARYLHSLPEWANYISARQLAHHTAGLPEAGTVEAELDWIWTETEVTEYLGRLHALSYPPGNGHRYSNLGYVLLARLVAAISGDPFADFVSRNLCDGEEGIGFTSDISAFPQAAYLGRPPLTQGDGGLWSTAPAYARWLMAQNRDASGVATIVEAPGRLADGQAVDYGWGFGLREYRGERLLMHGGGWTGATAKALRCPALGLAVVVLTAGGDVTKVAALADAALELAYSSDSSAVR